ncbi:hypothetical protein HGRIS_004521 [Hohenbuehelia grisea]|uniref:Uncharacterized protein n=1 Tax=Hohenbuehelia grisea TaxID=104357 RepID=A0ABR3JCI5_9AGAR
MTCTPNLAVTYTISTKQNTTDDQNHNEGGQTIPKNDTSQGSANLSRRPSQTARLLSKLGLKDGDHQRRRTCEPGSMRSPPSVGHSPLANAHGFATSTSEPRVSIDTSSSNSSLRPPSFTSPFSGERLSGQSCLSPGTMAPSPTQTTFYSAHEAAKGSKTPFLGVEGRGRSASVEHRLSIAGAGAGKAGAKGAKAKANALGLLHSPTDLDLARRSGAYSPLLTMEAQEAMMSPGAQVVSGSPGGQGECECGRAIWIMG